MDRNTALGAAAGVTLAVVGAVSALFLTIDQPADAAESDTPVVEYVDQYGNPVAAPAASDAGVVVMNADGTMADTAAYSEDEHGEDEYEEHGEEAEDYSAEIMNLFEAAATRYEEFADNYQKDQRSAPALQNAYLLRLGLVEGK